MTTTTTMRGGGSGGGGGDGGGDDGRRRRRRRLRSERGARGVGVGRAFCPWVVLMCLFSRWWPRMHAFQGMTGRTNS